MPIIPTGSSVGRAAVAAIIAVFVLGGVAGCVPPGELDPAPSAGGSAALLDQLTVASGGTTRGYDRDKFPHWRSTGDNCDVRDTVLARDGEDIRLDGCNVIGGNWLSVYDDRALSDPSTLDIDHTVPLAEAWRSGADEWDNTRRGDFANDLTRPQLIAVSASSNRAKGDKDPSRWKPPSRDYWCQYAQDWITVKHYWQLSVTSEEKSALTEMLATCAPTT